MSVEHFIKPNSVDSHQVSAYWLALIVRYNHRRTYDRFSKKQELNRSFEGSDNNAVASDNYIIVNSDCIAWECSSSTGSHISALNMTLKQTDLDYQAKVVPGDWVIFWAFNSKGKYERVIEKIHKQERVNGVSNAPKFIGKVATIFDNVNVAPGGIKTVTYSVTCNGFSELDSTMYYNESVGQKYRDVTSKWADFGAKVNDLIIADSVDTNEITPELLKIMLGVGPGAKYKGNLTENSNSGVVVSPNDVYLIPPMIANLLLPKSQTAEKQTFSYADLLNTYIGVESYEKNLPHPDVTKDSTYSNVFKGRPLFGQFAPAAANFNDTSFWSILDLFLGAPINEMFTCLRPAPLEDGDSEHHIMPSFVMRQLPKTSLAFNEPDFAVTTFRSLPRWVIDDSFITNVNTGRSGALRFNYVQLRGFSPVEGDNVIKYMYILSPPVFDGADIKRSGLHTFIKDVKVIFKANGGDNKNYAVWNRFMADIVFEQHLTLTGTANLKGIEEPIVEGDNCVIGGTLYHIERVSHSGVLQPNGMKTFNTSLSLTHGIAVDPKFTSQTKDLAGYDEHSQALVAYSNLEDGNPLDGSFEDLPPEPKAPVNSGSFNSRPGQTEK